MPEYSQLEQNTLTPYWASAISWAIRTVTIPASEHSLPDYSSMQPNSYSCE